MTLPPEGQYITPHPDPLYWDKHINGMLLQEFYGFIGGDVLEIGCNHGAVTKLISKIKGVKMVTGIDINKEAIAMAKSQYPDLYFSVADIRYYHQPNCWDFIISFHTLEHIENPIKAVGAIYDNLDSGGGVLISVPYKDAYGSDNYHVNSFDEESLSDLFYGFEIIECKRDQRKDLHGNDHDVLNLFARKWK